MHGYVAETTMILNLWNAMREYIAVEIQLHAHREYFTRY